MTGSPPMLTGHLAHGLLHTLADLDGEHKLLGISALLKTTKTTIIGGHIKHPVGLVAVLVSQCVLTYLVSIKHNLWSCARKKLTSHRFVL